VLNNSSAVINQRKVQTPNILILFPCKFFLNIINENSKINEKNTKITENKIIVLIGKNLD
jgi:hypothetical protein